MSIKQKATKANGRKGGPLVQGSSQKSYRGGKCGKPGNWGEIRIREAIERVHEGIGVTDTGGEVNWVLQNQNYGKASRVCYATFWLRRERVLQKTLQRGRNGIKKNCGGCPIAMQ